MWTMIRDFFFGPKAPPERYRVDKDNKRDPKAGDVYRLQPKNPFAETIEAYVFEIKDGWVRYSFWPKDDKYARHSDSIEAFLRFYNLLVEVTDEETIE